MFWKSPLSKSESRGLTKRWTRLCKNLSSYDWLILTSVNGVERSVGRALRKLRIGREQFNHVKIAAIGPATARAIEAHGLKVNLVPKEYVAESVVAGLRRKVKGKRVLLARAKSPAM